LKACSIRNSHRILASIANRDRRNRVSAPICARNVVNPFAPLISKRSRAGSRDSELRERAFNKIQDALWMLRDCRRQADRDVCHRARDHAHWVGDSHAIRARVGVLGGSHGVGGRIHADWSGPSKPIEAVWRRAANLHVQIQRVAQSRGSVLRLLSDGWRNRACRSRLRNSLRRARSAARPK
jgi:hypothetical protein